MEIKIKRSDIEEPKMVAETILPPEHPGKKWGNGDWLVIPLTSSQTVIHNSSGVSVYLRTGALSGSKGVSINPNEKIILDETVYVRATSATGSEPTIVVMR